MSRIEVYAVYYVIRKRFGAAGWLLSIRLLQSTVASKHTCNSNSLEVVAYILCLEYDLSEELPTCI